MKSPAFTTAIVPILSSALLFAVQAVAGEETAENPQPEASEEAQEVPDAGVVGVIETKFGKIVLEFFLGDAPKHVENFKKLASEGFYNGTTFHRVIPGFVIQGGDPNTKDEDRSNDGTGGPGYTVNAEFNSRKHQRGTLAMARSMEPNSAGSQFYICVAPQPALDGKYTVFGQVIEGMDAVDKIVSVKRDSRDNPIEPVVMEKVYIEAREK